MLQRGILEGMISDFFFGEHPKFVWCVHEDGEVYEAKTDAVTPGSYHGYRLEEQVVERLESERVSKTNLETIWKSVLEEREGPESRRARKLEALLGREPDESDPEMLARLIADAERLSVAAVEEIAADPGRGGKVPTAEDLYQIAAQRGFDASPRDTVRLASSNGLPRFGEVAAWKLGAAAAKSLREQEDLDGAPISDEQLAKMAATQRSVVRKSKQGGGDLSFALDDNPQHSRLVLRSKWETGRRFELARLLGDRIAGSKGGQLFPATRAYTYRQKMQRSFAAEFLSPFDVIDEMLDGDYSMENQLEVAHHFRVSEWTIRIQLVNHGRLKREDDADLDAAA
jgi:hypothetical protein